MEQGHDFDPSFYSISAVCGVLVDFLKELPSPLLTYEVDIIFLPFFFFFFFF